MKEKRLDEAKLELATITPPNPAQKERELLQVSSLAVAASESGYHKLWHLVWMCSGCVCIMRVYTVCASLAMCGHVPICSPNVLRVCRPVAKTGMKRPSHSCKWRPTR